MNAPTSTHNHRPFLKRRITWIALLIVIIPLILFVGWYLAYWGNIDFGPQKLVSKDECRSSGNHLLTYLSAKGNGHIDLVDKTGKVHGSIKLDEASYVGPLHWDDDCKAVRLGGANGMEELKISP